MPAEKRGFCRNSAASRVEPERGRPEMKWRRLCMEETSLEKRGARRAGLGIIEFGSLFVIRVVPLTAVSIAPGVDYFPGFLDRAAQEALRNEVLAILKLAPLF